MQSLRNRIRPRAAAAYAARQAHPRARRTAGDARAALKVQALAATIGRWAFDYATLLAALAAVGATPSPALVLLAFCAAQVLAQVPVTPGGLGFVEAGLTATLTLAGVGPGKAVLATLAYRLFAYWLQLPAGLVGFLIHKRRYSGAEAAS